MVSRLVRSTVRPLGGDLNTVVGGWSHRAKRRQGLLLCLETHQGDLGYGEASPLPGYSPDPYDAVESCLQGLVLAGLEIPDEPKDMWTQIAALSCAIPVSLPTARLALETAVIDLTAKRLRLPAHTLVAHALGLPVATHPLALSHLLEPGTVELMEERAVGAFERGFRTFKLKCDPVRPLEELRLRLQRLRARFGDRVQLRVDVNQGWSLREASGHLRALEEFALEFVEEPVSARSRAQLEPSATPLALDESLADSEVPWDAPRPPSAIVVKPMLHGLLGAVAIARQARHRGLSVILTHCFDGPVAHAVTAALALVLGAPERAHGLEAQPGWHLLPAASVAGIDGCRLSSVGQPGLPLTGLSPC